MTASERELVAYLRSRGHSYANIALRTGLSESAVKSHCNRNNLSGSLVAPSVCAECGTALVQTAHRKQKTFCCAKCRQAWWNHRRQLIQKKTYSEHVCAGCGNSFQSYANPKRKYCSHSCYIKARYHKEEADG